ncbi:prepilin-type N-terminal cleavage/methylation domain-containing protein [Candidatus Saccharibacteria bacterium]|nr:prepilin-type N-terminal cleavage/methylation domain-containing protein [Candidatus Saccharibacteria bacterium]
MPSKQRKTNKGFTIIEVVLVLAIAGLIFLMVFVAFPALQRSQQDTQRQTDISRLSTQITNFKTNNTNAIPGASAKNDNATVTITGASIDSNAKVNTRGTWAYFYKNYLLAGGDTFQDPDGSPYNLQVVYCGASGTAADPDKGTTAGADCKAAAQRYSSTFAAQDHTILVVLGAACDGEASVASAGLHDIAMVYKRDGGGTICIAN